jgi:manganese transport protein
LLFLINKGIRKMEAFIIALVVIGALFLKWFCTTWHGDVLYGLIPSMPNETALYIAIGIIGYRDAT